MLLRPVRVLSTPVDPERAQKCFGEYVCLGGISSSPFVVDLRKRRARPADSYQLGVCGLDVNSNNRLLNLVATSIDHHATATARFRNAIARSSKIKDLSKLSAIYLKRIEQRGGSLPQCKSSCSSAPQPRTDAHQTAPARPR